MVMADLKIYSEVFKTVGESVPTACLSLTRGQT